MSLGHVISLENFKVWHMVVSFDTSFDHTKRLRCSSSDDDETKDFFCVFSAKLDAVCVCQSVTFESSPFKAKRMMNKKFSLKKKKKKRDFLFPPL